MAPRFAFSFYLSPEIAEFSISESIYVQDELRKYDHRKQLYFCSPTAD
jgi:hypothetical protein